MTSIVITGASSGIGHALALLYAGKGVVLGLQGRDATRLEEVARQCRDKGATVELLIADVRDRAACDSWLADFDRRHPADLLIASAGINGGTRPGSAIESAEESLTQIETNVVGLLNTVHPLLPGMMARARGQIALLSSLAGLIPLPDSPSYCASKFAVRAYGLALRQTLRAHGVKVNVICPGYVSTPMSRRMTGAKPFEMSAGEAARRIARGLQRNTAVIAFPFWFALLSRVGGMLPDPVRRYALQPFRFNVKDAE